METVADLHIHSRYSIATGKQADLEHLDLWGRYKGVQVVGTGDCTHPEWLREMAAKLEPVAAGTYVLKAGLSLPLGLKGPAWPEIPPSALCSAVKSAPFTRRAAGSARSTCSCCSPILRRPKSCPSAWDAWAMSPRTAAPSWVWTPNMSWKWSWKPTPDPW